MREYCYQWLGLRAAFKWITIMFIGGWIALITGCTSIQDRYSHYEILDRDGWNQGDELFFTLPKLTPNKRYSVELSLRLDRNLRYEELPIGVLIETPERTFDTKVIRLSTSTDFIHLGGYNYYEVLHPLGEITFEESGLYSYSVRHLSTDSILQGVLEVGLIVEPIGAQ